MLQSIKRGNTLILSNLNLQQAMMITPAEFELWAVQMYRLVVHTFERSVKKACLWKPVKLVFSTQVNHHAGNNETKTQMPLKGDVPVDFHQPYLNLRRLN